MLENEISSTDAFDESRCIDFSDILEDGEALNENITLEGRCDQSGMGLNTLTDQCTLNRSICLSPSSDPVSTKHTPGSDVPESLAPLLSGEEASWSSSFATPTAAETTKTLIVPENTENSFINCSENNEECMIFPSFMRNTDVLIGESKDVASGQNTPCKDFIELEISLHQTINNERAVQETTALSCDENMDVTNVNCDELIDNNEKLSVSSICGDGDENVTDKFEKELGDLCVQNVSGNAERLQSSQKSGLDDTVPVSPCIEVLKEPCNVSNFNSTQELFQDISFGALDKLCQESEFLTTDTTSGIHMKNLKNSSKSPFREIASPGPSNSVPYFVRTSTPFSNVKRCVVRNKKENLTEQFKSKIELFSCFNDKPDLKENSKCLNQSESNFENDNIICDMIEGTEECEVSKLQIPTLSAIKSTKEKQNKLSSFFYRSHQNNSVNHSSKNVFCLDDLTKSALVLELAENMRQKDISSDNGQKEILKSLSAINDDFITVSELQTQINLQKNNDKVKFLLDNDGKEMKKHSDTNFLLSVKDNQNLTSTEVRSYLHDESTIVLNADSNCCSVSKQLNVCTLDCKTDAGEDINSTSDNEDIVQYSMSPVLNSVGPLKTVDSCCDNKIHEHMEVSNVSVNNVNEVNDKSDISNNAKSRMVSDCKGETVESSDNKTKSSDRVSDTQLIYALDAAEKMYELMQCDEQFSEWPVKINGHDTCSRSVNPKETTFGKTNPKNSEENVTTAEAEKLKNCERLERSNSDHSFSSDEMSDMVAKISHIEEQIFNNKQYHLASLSKNNLQNISIPVCKDRKDTKFIHESENSESKSEACIDFSNYESANKNVDKETSTGVEYNLKHISNVDKYTSFSSLQKANSSNIGYSSKTKLQKFISTLSKNKSENVSRVSDSVNRSASHSFTKNEPYVTDFSQKAKKLKIFYTSSNINSLVNSVKSESHSLNASTSVKNSNVSCCEKSFCKKEYSVSEVKTGVYKDSEYNKTSGSVSEYNETSGNVSEYNTTSGSVMQRSPDKLREDICASDVYRKLTFEDAVGCDKNITHKNINSSLSGSKMLSADNFDSLIAIEGNQKHSGSDQNFPVKNECNNLPSNFQGFSTAGGRKVHVSKEALCKAKLMFQDKLDTVEVDSDNGTEITVSDVMVLPLKETYKNHKFQGFSTASGKKVNVSEESLKKVKQMFVDGDMIFTDCKTDEITQSVALSIQLASPKEYFKTPQKFQGFSAANGKKLTISEESLNKVKQICQEMDSVSVPTSKSNISSTDTAEKIIDNVQKTVFEDEFKTPFAKFEGFSAPSGKKVNVCAESLCRVKQIFQDVDVVFKDSEDKMACSVVPSTKTIQQEEEIKSITPKFQGFSTASGKKVDISEKSLNKVKKIFQDIDMISADSDNKVTFSEVSSIEKTELKEEIKNITQNFQGFSTASGKKVHVSENSLSKVKQMFQDDDKISADADEVTNSVSSIGTTLLEKEIINTMPKFLGFSTASGKKANVSKESLSKVRKMFQDVGVISADAADEVANSVGASIAAAVLKDEIKNTTPTGFQGFSTASGKKVYVSEKSLCKVKEMFQDVDMISAVADDKVNSVGPSIEATAQRVKIKNNTPKFQGFSTASGKKVDVSEKSLSKAKEMFQDIEMISADANDKVTVSVVSNIKTTLLKEENKNTTPKFQGFSTASGKKVNVSEKSLSKVKQMFQDVDKISADAGEVTNSEPSIGTTLLKKEIKNTTPKFQGFSTASGKKVSVSEKSLSKVREMFQDVSAISADTNYEVANSVGPSIEATVLKDEIKNTTPTGFQGFSTASGKKVSVSEKSLRKVKEMFQDVDMIAAGADDEVTNSVGPSIAATVLKDEIKNTTPTGFQGFSTASGKKVNVSEKSLRKVKQMFQDVDKISADADEVTNSVSNIETSLLKKDIKSTVPKFQGFSTASGKKVSVSEKSLSKVREMFQDVSVISADTNCEVANSVGPSIEATILKDEIKSTTPTGFQGFSTASGKKVNVSEKSLRKVKEMFQDVDMISADADDEVANSVGPSIAASVLKDEIKNSTPIGFQGFSTASGKKVDVSENSLRKVKQMFLDDDIISVENVNKADISKSISASEHKKTAPENNLKLKFQCFNTASGKKVNVSEESLHRVKKFFLENDLVDNGNTCKHSESAVELFAKNRFPISTPTDRSSSFTNDNAKLEGNLLKSKQSVLKKPLNKRLSSCMKISKKNISLSVDKHKRKNVKFNITPSMYKGVTIESTVNNDSTQSQDKENNESHLISPGIKVKDVSFNKNVNILYDLNGVHDDALQSPILGSQYLSVKEKPLSPKTVGNNLEQELVTNVNDDISPVLKTGNKYVDSPVLGTQSKPLLTEFCVESPVLRTQRQNIVHLDSPIFGTQVEKTLTPESCSNSPCLGTQKGHLQINICNEKSFSEKADKINKVVNENLLISNTNISISNLNKRSQQDLNNDIGTNNLSGIMRVKKCLFGSSKSRTKSEQKMNESNANASSISLSCEELDRTTNAIMNFSDEVLESVAMFLEDEQLDTPSWATTYVTSPNMLADRCISPLVSFSPTDNLAAQSPIFGLNDRFETGDETYLHHAETTNNAPVTRHSKRMCCEKPVPLQKINSNPTPNMKKRCVDFTPPFAKRLHVSRLDNQRDHVMIAEARKKAADDQEAKICELKKSTVKTYKGSLYHKKMRKSRLSWREVADGQLPACYTATELCSVGVESSVIGMTAANAVDYRFCARNFYSPDICEKNISGIHVGDGAFLILDEAGFAGVNEFARAFLSSPGVDPSLVPSVSWIRNHFRWIVWKLACTERSFPKLFGKCLTPNNVMLQLRYRYDREIELSQRPAIRKILERDDTSVKRLVLCVADIKKVDTPSSSLNGDSTDKPLDQSAYDLELTDGWYSVWSTVDCEMTKFIESNLVTVGTKLITCGAELLNCDQGCSPLEVNKNVRLKLHTNSTRRARWYTKLGYQDNSGAFPVSLSAVLPAGGLISHVSVVVVRVYPVVYLEKLANGKTVIRGPRAEEREVTRFERKRQEKAEQVLSQLRAEISETVSDKRRATRNMYSAAKIRKITSGEELYQLLSESSDPTYFQNIISDEQKVELRKYQQQHQEDLNRQLETRLAEQLNDVTRKVASVFKVRCLDVNNVNSDKCTAVLSVWRATEDVMGLFKEGLSMRLYKVTPTGHRCKGSELQLSANRNTRYKPLKTVDYPSRKVTCLQQVTMKDFCPLFNEMDVVGVVIYSRVTSSNSETVYLADASNAILGICFWGSIKEFGFEDILTPEKFIAASNLQWRTRAHSHIPCAYATEQSLFSQNPVQQHLKEALSQLKDKVGHDVKSFVENCKKNIESSHKPARCVVPNRKPITHVKRTDPITNAMDIPAPTLLERKLWKLEQYGEPPALPPLNLSSVRRVPQKEFKVPFRSVTPESSPLSLDTPSE